MDSVADNNDRIDELIREHINISYKTNIEHIRRIRKAMEQYGLEQSKDGYVSGSDAVHKILKPEIDRLRELAKVQKELIAMYKGEPPHTLHDGKRYSELLNQIKQLES